MLFIYPPSSASANPSVGVNLDPIPASSTLVGAENPSGDLQPLQTNAAGDLLVEINTETSGLATATNQTTQITEAQATNTKLDTLNATDFATEAKQDSIISELQGVNDKLAASFFTLPYDTLQVTTKTANGPTQIVSKTGGLAGTTVQTLNIVYDIDGDFQSGVVS
jgi:hypothetical protein